MSPRRLDDDPDLDALRESPQFPRLLDRKDKAQRVRSAEDANLAPS
jgi:hypothetical protein